MDVFILQINTSIVIADCGGFENRVRSICIVFMYLVSSIYAIEPVSLGTKNVGEANG